MEQLLHNSGVEFIIKPLFKIQPLLVPRAEASFNILIVVADFKFLDKQRLSRGRDVLIPTGNLYLWSCRALEYVRTERSISEIRYNYKRFENYLTCVIMQSHVQEAHTKVLFQHEQIK